MAAIGITNQRETTVVWDKETGKPLHNAVVWLDLRTSELCESLTKGPGGQDKFRSVCGLPISTYFSAMKLDWLILNVPSVAKAVASGKALFGTIDTWLIWNLSGGVNGGVHVTDVTNASRTMLMDLATCQWSPATCKALNIPMAVLPTIKSCSEIYCKVAGTKLAGVPIAGCAGDQHAAMLGQACFSPGQAKSTYGTGCFMLMNVGEGKPVPSTHGLLSTVCFQLGPNAPVTYALEGSVAIAGRAVQVCVCGSTTIHSLTASLLLFVSLSLSLPTLSSFSVPPRQPGDDRQRKRDRAARTLRRLDRRRHLRPRLLRPLRSILALGREGVHRRHDSLHEEGPSLPRDARGGRSAGTGGLRCDGG